VVTASDSKDGYATRSEFVVPYINSFVKSQPPARFGAVVQKEP